MPDTVWMVPPVAALAVLGGVYLFSRDSGRRHRALELMRMLLGRRVDAGLARRTAGEMPELVVGDAVSVRDAASTGPAAPATGGVPEERSA